MKGMNQQKYKVRQANFLFGEIGLYGKRTLLVTPPHDGY
jgi:hypothetical protein